MKHGDDTSHDHQSHHDHSREHTINTFKTAEDLELATEIQGAKIGENKARESGEKDSATYWQGLKKNSFDNVEASPRPYRAGNPARFYYKEKSDDKNTSDRTTEQYRSKIADAVSEISEPGL